MNASTVDRLSKIMEDLAGVVDEMASGSETNGAFALACAKMAAWRQVEDSLKGRASQDIRERNALLPVHQLPVEVLAGIFETVVAWESYTDYRRLRCLRAVCHLWENVIDDSPWMWTRIRGSDPSRIVEEALKKSSTCPLDVSFHYYTQDDPSRFLGTLDPHFNRLRSVEIIHCRDQTPEEWFTGNKLFTMPRPSLERFSLRNCSPQTNFPELTLFANQAPRLKGLELQGIRVNCPGAIFGGLSSLSLAEVTVPSLKDLLGALNRCGHLLSLQLEQIWFRTVDTVEPPPERISLPFLRRLSLRKMPSTFKERLLRDVYVPQCADIAVTLQADAEDPKDLVTRYVPKWFSQRTPSLPEIPSIAGELAEGAVYLYFYDSKDSEYLRLSLHHDQSASTALAVLTAVNTVLKAVAPEANTHLTFGQAVLVLAEDRNYTDQLGFLPGVTKLGIGEGWLSFGRGYLESSGAQNFNLPAFPCLQELCFYERELVGIVKVVMMLVDASEVRCQAKMENAFEEVEKIVGEERVIIGVDPAAKQFAQAEEAEREVEYEPVVVTWLPSGAT